MVAEKIHNDEDRETITAQATGDYPYADYTNAALLDQLTVYGVSAKLMLELRHRLGVADRRKDEDRAEPARLGEMERMRLIATFSGLVGYLQGTGVEITSAQARSFQEIEDLIKRG